MKILSLCYAIVPCLFVSYADASIGCGTPQLRTDISSNMDEAINLIATVNQTLYGWCSPNDLFPCPSVDTSAAIANLTRASEFFYWAIYNYTAYLEEEDYTIDCSDVQKESFCDCASMKNLCEYILDSYGTTYATQWNNFLTLSTSSPLCPFQASSLRLYASNYYCDTLYLINSLKLCPDRCVPCPDLAFQTYVSTNMNTAYQYMFFANLSITEYCAEPDSPDVAQILNSTITALNLAMDLFYLTAVNYTQYLNGSYFPPPCFAPPIVCDCNLLASTLASVFREFGFYNGYWSEFISSTGKDMPCDELASRLRSSANELFCDARTLKQILSLCQSPCISPEVANTISGAMEQAMTLIDSVISVYPTPCTSGSSFCLGSNFTSVLSDLQEASNYFAQVWANYTELINDGETNITCIPQRTECSCRVIGELLAELNSSYTDEYLPAWTIYSTGPSADCDDRAKNLRTLVAQYYCIAQDLYRDYSECQALCATDWCDYYNCSAQPCPPCISSADNTTIINSMDLAISLIEAVIAVYPNPCNQSDGFCSGANLTSTIADLQQASLLFAESYGSLTAVIGDGESTPSCSQSQPDCNCRVIGQLLLTINGSYYDDFLPAWANYSDSNTDCLDQAKYLRGLIGQYYCITQDLTRDYEQCLIDCNTDWCAYYNCTVPPCVPCLTPEQNSTISENMDQAISLIEEVMLSYPSPCSNETSFCFDINLTEIITGLENASILFAATYENLTAIINDNQTSISCVEKVPTCSCRIIEILLVSLNSSYYEDYLPVWQNYSTSLDYCVEQAQYLRDLVGQYYCITKDLQADYSQCQVECETDWCEFYNCTVPPCPCVTAEFNETITTNMESALSLIQEVMSTYPVPCLVSEDFCSSSNFTSILDDLQQASGLFAETYANLTIFIGDGKVNLTCSSKQPECNCRLIGELLETLNMSYYADFVPLWNVFANSTSDCNQQALDIRNLVARYYCFTEDLSRDYQQCIIDCQTDWCEYYNCTVPPCPCVTQELNETVTSNMESALSFIQDVILAYPVPCLDGADFCSSSNFTSILEDLQQASGLFAETYANLTTLIGDGNTNITCSEQQPDCNCRVIGQLLEALNMSYYADFVPLWNVFANSTSDCKEQAEQIRSLVAQYYCITEDLTRDYEQCVIDCNTDWCEYYNCTVPPCIPCLTPEQNITISSNMESAISFIEDVMLSYPSPCSNETSFCLNTNLTEIIAGLEDASILFATTYEDLTTIINDNQTAISCVEKVPTCSCRVIEILLVSLNSSYYEEYLPVWQNYSTSFDYCVEQAQYLRDLVGQYYCITKDLQADYTQCQVECETDWCDYYNCTVPDCSCVSKELNETITNNMESAVSFIQEVMSTYPVPCLDSDDFCSSSNFTSILADLQQASNLFAETYANLTIIVGDGEVNVTCTRTQPECDCRLIGQLLDFLNMSYYADFVPLWTALVNSTSDCKEQAEDIRNLVAQYYCITEDLSRDYQQCLIDCQTDWCEFYNCTVPPCPCVTAEFNETVTTNMESALSFIQEVMSTYPVPCLDSADFCSSSNFTSILEDLQQASGLFAETYANLTTLIGDGNSNIICSEQQPECSCRVIGQLLETLNMSYYADFVPMWNVFANSTSNCKEQAEQIRNLVAQYYCITEDLSRDYQQCIIDCNTDWCDYYNCTVPPCPCVTAEFNETVTTNMESAVSFIQDVILAYPVPCVDGADFCSVSNFTSILADLQQASGLFAETYANLTTLIGDGNSNIICSDPQSDCNCRVIGQLLEALNVSYYADFVPLWTALVNSTSDCKEQAEQIRNLVAQYYCITEDLTRDYEQCVIDCNTDWCEYYNCTDPPCVPCLTPEQNITISSNMDQAISFIEDVMISSPLPCLNETSFCSGINITEILNSLDDAGILFAETYANYTAIIGDSQVISCTSKQPECSCRLIDGQLVSLNGSYYEEYLPVWQNYSTNSFQPNCEAAKYLRALVEQYYCITQDLYRDYAECQTQCDTDWCEFYNCTVPPCPCITPEQNATISGNMIDAMQLIDLVIAANPSPCLNGSAFCSGTNLEAIMTNLEDAGTLFAETYANLTAIIKDGEVITCLDKEPACSCRVIEGELVTLNSSYYSDYLPAWEAFSNSTTDCEAQAKYIRELVAQYYCITQDLLRDYEACLTLCDTDWCEYYNCTTPPCQYCITPLQNVTISGNMEEAISLIDSVMSANPSPCVDGVSFCSNVNLVSIRNSLQEASALFAQTFANYTSIINDGAVISPCVKEQPECSCRLINDQLASLNGSYHEDYLPVWEIFSTAVLSPACQEQALYLRALVQRYYCIAEDLYRDYGVCQVECNQDWCRYYNCSSGPCPPPRPCPWVMILGAIADAAARRCRSCSCGY